MAHPVFVFGLGAIAMYGYATGRINDFIDKKFGNKNGESSSSSSMTTSPSKPATIIVQPALNNNNRNSYLIPFGCAAIFGLGGYYYYIHSSGTKKVINRVEETAEETQTLVQQTDDNNCKRFEILDKKNEIRAQNLEIEIRSEQRAGFDVIKSQLYCLQQVAIQTLNTVASLSSSSSSSSNNEQDDNNIINEKLIGYCDKAQEMADTIISDQHILKTKENNLKEIKAEIQHRNNQYDNIIINNNINDITPGGPAPAPDNDNDNDNDDSFDINHNQPTKLISYKDNIDNNINIKSTIKPIEIGYYIWNNRQYIILGTGVILVFSITKKISNIIIDYNDNNNNNNNNNNSNYKVIQQ